MTGFSYFPQYLQGNARTLPPVMQQLPFLPSSFTKHYSLITNLYASPKIVRVVISRKLLLMGM
jgi:hypothetical protein